MEVRYVSLLLLPLTQLISRTQAGNIDEAEAVKKRVEEKQRAKRKALLDAGEEPPVPAWFVKHGEEWRYGGEYCALVLVRTLEKMPKLTSVPLLRSRQAGSEGFCGP